MSDTPRRVIIKGSPNVKDASGSYLKPEVVVTEINLDRIHEELLRTLSRESQRLDRTSETRLLSKEEGVAFDRCVKVFREFRKEDREEADRAAAGDSVTDPDEE